VDTRPFFLGRVGPGNEARRGVTGRVGTITGLDYWNGLLGWTIGLTQTAKYNSFSAEQKLNVLISSVTSLTLLPTASFLEFLEVKGHMHI